MKQVFGKIAADANLSVFGRPLSFTLAALLSILATGLSAFSQSTNQNYPSPVRSNEIVGTIKARDLGDSRLTSYYFVFDGEQGDVFVNVVTKNLDGDIDVFTADNLRPLTKITVYSDNPDGETGRVIYLRQPQRLILRIEGKTPTDESATFRIKFAGSFKPLAGIAEAEPDEPSVKPKTDGDIRVNSVGTIIEVKPKPTPTPKATVAKVEKPAPVEKEDKKVDERDETVSETKVPVETTPEVTVPSPDVEKTDEPKPVDNKPSETKVQPVKKPATVAKVKKPKEKKTPVPKVERKSEPAPLDATQLAAIKLVVLFKDGTKIERGMDEVLKFGVDKGILTIISKDGKIGRYSMLDIEKVTIE